MSLGCLLIILSNIFANSLTMQLSSSIQIILYSSNYRKVDNNGIWLLQALTVWDNFMDIFVSFKPILQLSSDGTNSNYTQLIKQSLEEFILAYHSEMDSVKEKQQVARNDISTLTSNLLNVQERFKWVYDRIALLQQAYQNGSGRYTECPKKCLLVGRVKEWMWRKRKSTHWSATANTSKWIW